MTIITAPAPAKGLMSTRMPKMSEIIPQNKSIPLWDLNLKAR